MVVGRAQPHAGRALFWAGWVASSGMPCPPVPHPTPASSSIQWGSSPALLQEGGPALAGCCSHPGLSSRRRAKTVTEVQSPGGTHGPGRAWKGRGGVCSLGLGAMVVVQIGQMPLAPGT